MCRSGVVSAVILCVGYACLPMSVAAEESYASYTEYVDGLGRLRKTCSSRRRVGKIACCVPDYVRGRQFRGFSL